jgi:MFS family permease
VGHAVYPEVHLMPAHLFLAPGPQPVHMTPTPSALPDSGVIQSLANGLDSWALIAAMVGVVLGAVIWAFGHYSQNYQQAYNGRKGVIVSGLAALLMGAAPEIVNFLFSQGQTAK